ncbi:hypothetical protein BofuT4_P033310.1 [Botrytis cinerea T4]|uniref:Uncharacterized protein n=1 Tax=Botryotinia fuckeliana (strain T4) TaxID=999810 RepID=G2Y7W1_BOTF4|nr:hypothetical protein BofuT4_P033310.1 [Botrytis cinerea T4]
MTDDKIQLPVCCTSKHNRFSSYTQRIERIPTPNLPTNTFNKSSSESKIPSTSLGDSERILSSLTLFVGERDHHPNPILHLCVSCFMFPSHTFADSAYCDDDWSMHLRILSYDPYPGTIRM